MLKRSGLLFPLPPGSMGDRVPLLCTPQGAPSERSLFQNSPLPQDRSDLPHPLWGDRLSRRSKSLFLWRLRRSESRSWWRSLWHCGRSSRNVEHILRVTQLEQQPPAAYKRVQDNPSLCHPRTHWPWPLRPHSKEDLARSEILGWPNRLATLTSSTGFHLRRQLLLYRCLSSTCLYWDEGRDRWHRASAHEARERAKGWQWQDFRRRRWSC